MLEKRNCLNCGKQFNVSSSHKTVKFCSRKCYWAHTRKAGEEEMDLTALTEKLTEFNSPEEYAQNFVDWLFSHLDDPENKDILELYREARPEPPKEDKQAHEEWVARFDDWAYNIKLAQAKANWKHRRKKRRTL